MPDSVIYRVVKLPETLLTAVREKRDQEETTNASFVAAAVEDHLPRLIEELQRIGFGVCAGDTKTARLPFSDDAAVLGQLKEAAEMVGLPTTRLLKLCLVTAVTPGEGWKRRRRRTPKSNKVAKANSKGPDGNVKSTRPHVTGHRTRLSIIVVLIATHATQPGTKQCLCLTSVTLASVQPPLALNLTPPGHSPFFKIKSHVFLKWFCLVCSERMTGVSF